MGFSSTLFFEVQPLLELEHNCSKMERPTEEIILRTVFACQPLRELTKAEAQELATNATLKNFNRNQTVFESDQKGKYVYIVSSGSFKLTLLDQVEKTLAPCELFGEVAALTGHMRLGSIVAATKASAVSFAISYLEHHLSPGLFEKITKLLTRHMAIYLADNRDRSALSMIRAGENDTVEFKQSFHYPEKILKTVVGMMNSRGGTIFVGVNDETQKIIGLGSSYKQADRSKLALIHQIQNRIGASFASLVRFRNIMIKEKQLIRIDITASTQPVFLKPRKKSELDEGECFYLRVGPSTSTLKQRALVRYVARHFEHID